MDDGGPIRRARSSMAARLSDLVRTSRIRIRERGQCCDGNASNFSVADRNSANLSSALGFPATVCVILGRPSFSRAALTYVA